MTRSANPSIPTPFRSLPDPRGRRTRCHSLHDILVIALGGVICGADDWVAIERFGKAKVAWFRSFLDLRHGIPSHDTFGRVFAALDPEAFKAAFLAWVHTLAAVMPGDVIAIDGKTLRQTFDTAADKAAIPMVSAWAAAQGLCLGQIKTDAKSNEITAIPTLLEVLALAGRIVTIDARGCQKDIARAIHRRRHVRAQFRHVGRRRSRPPDRPRVRRFLEGGQMGNAGTAELAARAQKIAAAVGASPPRRTK